MVLEEKEWERTNRVEVLVGFALVGCQSDSPVYEGCASLEWCRSMYMGSSCMIFGNSFVGGYLLCF